MSQISEKDMIKIAKLARIKLSKEDQENFAGQISKIVTWLEQLGEADTENTEIFTNAYDMNMRMEKDEVSDGDISADVLKNAKGALYEYFSVPKVIE